MLKRIITAASFLAVIFFAPMVGAERLGYDDSGNPIQAMKLDYANSQTVSYDASTATTNAVGSAADQTNGVTVTVRIYCSTSCHYTAATSPTATTSHPRLGGDQTEYITVEAADKVAFIKANAAGTATVTVAK